MMIFFNWKGFGKNPKNWSFWWPRICGKMKYFSYSQFCRDCSQTSEYLHFRYPDVLLWWFYSIKKPFGKIPKIEIFHDRGPVENCHFLHIHIFADFAAKWVNIYSLGILMSYYDGSLQFERLSEKSKKMKFFMTADLSKNVTFCIFTFFEDFAAKWVNIYILEILMSYYDGSLQFKRLSEKSKKLKFFLTADLSKNVIFWIFTFLQILQPNE